MGLRDALRLLLALVVVELHATYKDASNNVGDDANSLNKIEQAGVDTLTREDVQGDLTSDLARGVLRVLAAGWAGLCVGFVPSAHGETRPKVFRVQLDRDTPLEQVRIQSRQCKPVAFGPCSRLVLVDGRRRVALTTFGQRPKFPYHWRVARVQFRDLTGDGVNEVIFDLRTVGATVSSPTLMGVDQWDGRRRSSIFRLANGGVPEPGYSFVVTARGEIVRGSTALPEIATTEGLLDADDANCCPSAYRKLRHRWDGHRISAVPGSKEIVGRP